MRIYVDTNSVYAVNAGKLDTYVPMSQGGHAVTVQAWDSTGAVFKSSMSINVAGSATGVSVSSPAPGATVGSPVHFAASASSAYPISTMMIYVDNTSVYQVSAAKLDTYVPIAAGSHYVVVQAWDQTGAVLKTPMNISVSGSAPAATNGTLISNIDQMTGWQNCTVCAGAGGNGSTASFSMTQYVGSPSMDGQSAQFWIGGSTPYSDVLWWKQLGAQSGATHFAYDGYFYLVNPGAPQALEFDVNQAVGGVKYIFGTQCDIRGARQWEVWDGANRRWVQTGIACSVPPAYQWNHVTLEFWRSGYSQATFVSVTLNGVKSYINRSFWQIPSSVNELNVAFQMDGNYTQEDYSVWLDKVSLRYW